MTRGRRFRHPFSSRLPAKLEDGEALKLVAECNWSRLIEGHLRLAATIVSRYLSTSSNSDEQAEELVSVAFCAVVDAVRLIREKGLKHDNVTASIAVRINGDLRDALASGRSVIHRPNTNYADVMPDREIKLSVDGHDVPTQPDTTLDLTETIQQIVKDGTDVQIVELLQLGYTALEIAGRLDLHKSNVHKRIIRIREEFLHVTR